MAMYTLPRPALDFGSDSRGTTDPLRYSSQRLPPPHTRWQSQSDSPGDQTRATGHDLLPGVDQLLTPTTRSSVPPSPYPAQQSPKKRPSLSAGQGPATELPPNASQAHESSYQPSQASNHLQFTPKPAPQRESFVGSIPPPASLTQAYVSNTGSIPAPYSGYPNQSPHAPFSSQAPFQQMAPTGYLAQLQQQQLQQQQLQQQQQQQAPTQSMAPASHQTYPQTSPVQYYPEAGGGYSVPTHQAGSPEQPEKGTENPVKLQPRVVRDAVLPGEGPVWVYEDGTTCPKVIDGEPVNAEWGVTKAGKPRKRLAIACTTCREKKIKCQPALPKCAQCEKLGRECHYATAPRIQQATPESPSYEFQARNKPMTVKTEPPNRVLLPSTVKSPPHPDAPVIKRANTSPEPNVVRLSSEQTAQKQPRKPPFKKQRSGLQLAASDSTRYPPKEPRPGKESPSTKASWEDDLSKVPLIRYDWSTDPYHIDAEATRHYMQMYFLHVNTAVHRLFPRDPFIRWLESKCDKSPEDLMLIYAMLALGSRFSTRKENKSDGQLFSKIACQAVETSRHKYSLQLTQSRMLLSFYYFAVGGLPTLWDFAGQGLRAASGLKLNLEESCRDIKDSDEPQYGLKWPALIECRRRTFWSAYITDRFCGFHSDHMSVLHSQDAFLRLPCDEDAYSRQKATSAPFFYNGLMDPGLCKVHHPSALGPAAYLVNLACIWGDVLTYIYRHSREPAGEHASNYEKFHRDMTRRLCDWKTSLPKDLEFSASNTALSIEKGTLGMFLKLHSLYHATVMKLNRTFRHDVLSTLSSGRNFTKARRQALELLKMMETIDSASRASKNALDTSGNFPEFSEQTLDSCSPLASSTPFAGHAALLAIDILSAGGCIEPEPFKNLIRSMTAGLTIVDELSQCWISAIGQKKAILRRLETLCASATSGDAAVKKVWRCRRALDTACQSGHDVFYPDGDDARDTFFEHLQVDVEEEEILYID